MKIKLKDIRLDGGTQPRQFINQDVVADYTELLLESAVFPPVTVFHDGANFWLGDGFHRFFANKKAGFIDIECDVKQGTMRDAVLFSVGTNADHGLRRTNEDKRKAIQTLTEDIEWGEWSDSEIARRCNVSNHLVARVKKMIGLEQTEKKYTTKHGTVAKMKMPEKPAEVETLKPVEEMIEVSRLQELAAAHEELAAENEKLLHKVAVQHMEGTEEEKQAAANTLEEQRSYITQLEAELRAVKASRDQFQSENAELKKQVAYWRKKAEKVAA